jgi:polar amino acid transport system substrate-binding protein
MSAQRAVAATFTALALAALAACTSFGYEPTPLPQSSASATASPSATATTAADTCNSALESYTPPAAVPTNLSRYPTVHKIRRRGRLIVGGSATSLLLAARNPISGRIEGFDVDLARQVAKAIFGDPRQDPAAGRHQRRPHPGAAERQRGPDHQRDDHQLRPLATDRVLG